MAPSTRTILRVWAVGVTAVTLLLAAGAALRPDLVWDRYLWRYCWGPVAADGRGENWLVRIDGVTQTPAEFAGTQATALEAGIVAEPGYTTISTASYAVVLLAMLVGVYFLLLRLEVGDQLSFIYGFVPFVFLGGVLRTIEDANIALLANGDPLLPFPYTAVIISPFIYFFMFGLGVVALLISVALARRRPALRYEYPLAAIGSVLLVGALSVLAWLAVTTDVVTFTLWIPVVTLLGATVATAATWWAARRLVPTFDAGTGVAGGLIIWGHAVDGVANVLSLDWIGGYDPKDVVNAWVRDVTNTVQPAWLSDAIGITWPFLPLKLILPAVIVYLFNADMYHDSPRYTVLLLLTVLAVGLGPGTRDFLRATFGI